MAFNGVCERYEHNEVYLSGVVVFTPEDSERVFGEEMLPICLDVLRLSGEVDEIPVYVPIKLVATTPGLSLHGGGFVSVHGQLRTLRAENGKHFAKVVAEEIVNRTEACGFINRVRLTGEVCGQVDSYDTNLTNRRLTKLPLAAPYSSVSYGGTAHVSALFWGAAALETTLCKQGDVVSVCGRLQSRRKTLSPENGGGECVCVELSVGNFTPLSKTIGCGKGIFGR